MKNKKILFFDIDGTILSETTHTIPSSAFEAIQKARENGHIAIINTGRPYSTIDKMILDIGFDGFVCGCGTNVYFNDAEIYHHTLDKETRRRIIDLSYSCHVNTMFEGKYGVSFKNSITHPFVEFLKDIYTKGGFPVQVCNEDEDTNFDKFTVWYTEDSKIEEFKKAIENDFTIIQRAEDFIEVVPKACSKATGIDVLTKYLDMTIDSTISFGDSTNDLAMLTHTKESVAMGNSNPILFDKVTYITTHVDNDGIKNALMHFGLLD